MLRSDDYTTKAQTISLLVLAVVVGTFSIYWLRPVLVPLVVALFVVSGIVPILNALERRLGVNRIIAAGLTFLTGLFLLVVFGLSIWVSMVDLSRNANAYRQRVREIVNELEERTAEILPSLGEQVEPPASSVPERPGDASEFVDTFVREGISMVSQAFINLVSTSVVVLIYVFFLLIGSSGKPYQSPTVREIDQQIRSYLLLKTIVSVFTGAAFGLALRIFGVPMAFTFGVMAFLLNFVPNVGPLVASLLPIPLIVLDPDGSVTWMVAAISVACAIQLISGNLVEPKIMGESSDLHPVTILAALMFWGMMWGIIGMFLATPVTAAIRILLDRIDSTRPIASLMAGRWPQSPDSRSSAEDLMREDFQRRRPDGVVG